MIKEKRPEKPIWYHSPGDKGVEHFWNTDEEGKEIMKKEKKTEGEGDTPPGPKKKRGRPKGSKNKKKVEEKKELSVEELLILLEKKKEKKKEELEEGKEELEEGKKSGVDVDEEEPSKYIVDGVPYEIKGEEIMDPEDFSPIGVTDGKGGITFEDDDAKEKHLENVEKYSP
tara:strand:- start:62 stop:574 length:513 start_codon:yes stop_codon:yes gene_type:complete